MCVCVCMYIRMYVLYCNKFYMIYIYIYMSRYIMPSSLDWISDAEEAVQEEQGANSNAAALPSRPVAARAGVGDDMEEEDDMFVPEDFDEGGFEEDVGDEYAEMDDEDYIRPMAAPPAPAVAQSPAAATASHAPTAAAAVVVAGVETSAPALSDEQKARIARNKQLAMQVVV